MSRNYDNWLDAYVEYAGFSEAPKRMHFWSGVAAIAGALRRRVWLSMGYYRWCVNHYIIFVAPPGIVSKSTTMAIAMDILRKVPGINFGPDIVTWPALVSAFEAAKESFSFSGNVGDDQHTQCALTLESSEFGNLVNPADREMIDLLVTLWDSKQGGFKKVTKNSGNDSVENPWINMIACTTPSWIAGNFPEYVIGGGFTSRCLFVYTDQKEKLVAYPIYHIPAGMKENQTRLAADLEHISVTLCGAYTLSQAARAWGEAWYEHWYANPPPFLRDDRFGGYLARKQTHLHKLAMVIAASQRDELVITVEDLQLANVMISDLEPDMPKVFDRIGRSEESIQAERFIQFVQKEGSVGYAAAYQFIHSAFPFCRDFEAMTAGATAAGLLNFNPLDMTFNAMPEKKNVVTPPRDNVTTHPLTSAPASPLADQLQAVLEQSLPRSPEPESTP